jgi:hypothetical protein
MILGDANEKKSKAVIPGWNYYNFNIYFYTRFYADFGLFYHERVIPGVEAGDD